MWIIKHPVIIGYAVQPVSLATDIDARFIGMRQSRAVQFVFDPVFKLGQKLKGFFIEIEKRAFTDRYVQLVGKMILHPVVGDKLKLRHVHSVGLETRPILNRFGNTFGEGGDKPVAFIVFEDLGPVFGYEP